MKYPLQTLFEIRERAKKDSEEAYAKEKQKLDQEEKKLKELKEELASMKALRESKRQEYYEARAAGKIEVEHVKAGELYLQMLQDKENLFAEQIKAQEEVVEQAKIRTSKALEVMMKATEEFKVLEKHQEKWAAKRKKELEKKEEEAADEITQARYAHKEHKEMG